MTRALIILLAVSLLFCGGCMKIHTATSIEKDGSGTATLHFSMAKEVADVMQEMSDLPNNQMDDAPPSPSEVNKKDIEEAAAKYDVKVKKFEKFSGDDREGFEMELEFKKLSDLSHVLGGVMGGSDEGLGLFSTGDGNYVLKTTALDLPADDTEAEAEADMPIDPTDMSSEDMQKSMEVMGKMMAHMNDLDISMQITVPGDVIESNAPQVEGRTSSWTINSSNMMEAQGELEPVIKFSGKGVDIKAPALTD